MVRNNSARNRAARTAARVGGTSFTRQQWLRRAPLYRSILKWTAEGCAHIFAPADDLHPHRRYEIRHTDKETVLATVTGQQILDLRRDQLATYLAEPAPRGRTNISLVDVSSLLDVRVETHECRWGSGRARFVIGGSWFCDDIDELFQVCCSYCPHTVGMGPLSAAIEEARDHHTEHQEVRSEESDWQRRDDGTMIRNMPGRAPRIYHPAPCAPKFVPPMGEEK